MPDKLLSEATIHLFGCEVDDLELKVDNLGDRGTIAQALKAAKVGKDGKPILPVLARIYAFSYQNEYVKLASPALFVVSGPAEGIENLDVGATGLAEAPPTLATGLKVWTHECGDLSIRLDVTAGSFDRILLDYELADSGLQTFAPRGGNTLGQPSPMGGSHKRRPRWRSDDD